MRIDADLAKEFLSERLGGAVSGVETLSGGLWSQAFGFRHEGLDLVARFGRHLDDYEKDQVAARYASPSLPVPRVLEIAPAFDGHVCISERVFGTMIDDLDPAAMRSMAPAVLRLLDALREADPTLWIEAVGAPEASWTDQLLSVDEENDRVHGWHDNLSHSAIGLEGYRRALDFVRSNIHACPETANNLQHNDLVHFNVLAIGTSIVGVIDWGCAGLGDFLYELARFTFYAPWFPSMRGIHWVALVKDHYEHIGLDVPDFDVRLSLYEAHVCLSDMAYSAYRQNLAEIEWKARRILEVLPN